MPKLVTSGALLHCSFGSTNNTLDIRAPAGITVGTLPVATIADSKPGNFRPFGTCNVTNPPQPCTPAPATPWAPGSSSVRIGAVPVLNQNGQCHCQRGGLISIVSSSQQSTTVAAARSSGPVHGR